MEETLKLSGLEPLIVSKESNFVNWNEQQSAETPSLLYGAIYLFSYILSSLVLNKKTKHILLPIMNIDLNFSELENIIKNDIFIYQKIKFSLNNFLIEQI
jgi:hypothetical protein